jgi:dipeptidase E
MKLYLSSYRVGNQATRLQAFASGITLGVIPNARDHIGEQEREAATAVAVRDVSRLGIEVEMLDLQDYFATGTDLRSRLDTLGGVWVPGGNSFVLRQAMRLSGFDTLVAGMVETDFVYSGYSAGACVLAPTLNGLQDVDDATVTPYPGVDVVWEGLAILDYLILPHFRSDHSESADIDKAVAFCKAQAIPYKTLRDGEVIVIEDPANRDVLGHTEA